MKFTQSKVMSMNKRITLDRFVGGKNKALTMSYDDGRAQDRKLVEIFDKYGIRGTFNLNSGLLGLDERIDAEEAVSLYSHHEIAVHTVSHPSLPYVSTELNAREVLEDRQRLEEITGYPVRGMAYPNGIYNEQVKF